LSHDNNNTAFANARTGTTADYYYIVIDGERDTRLPCGFTYVIDASWQTTPDRLPYSEQGFIGGFSTVRGYDERSILGDQCLIVRNEVRTPATHLADGQASVQFLAFFDYGRTDIDHAQTGDQVIHKDYLDSVGAGVRFQINKHLTARFDEGFQLHDDAVLRAQPGIGRQHEHGHFALDLSF
jgi:hemolysin activation/secretion protein